MQRVVRAMSAIMNSYTSAHLSRGLFYFIACVLAGAAIAGFARNPAILSLFACVITVVFVANLILRQSYVTLTGDLPAFLFVALCWLPSLSQLGNPEVRSALISLASAFELGYLARYLAPDDRGRIADIIVGTAGVVTVLLATAVMFPEHLDAIAVNANICAGYILFGFVLSLTRIRVRVYRFLSILFFSGILVSGSRAALLAGGLIAGLYWWRSMPRPVRWGYCAAVVGACLLFITTVSSDVSVLNRLSWWQAGWRMFLDHPLFGSGWGMFGTEYLAYRPMVTENTAYAHNGIVQLLAEGGIAGAGLFALLLLSRSRGWGAGMLSPSAAAVGAFLVFNLFDYAWYIPAHQFVFFVLLLTLHTPCEGQSYALPLPARAGVAALAAACCLAALPARGPSAAAQAAQSETAFIEYLQTHDAAVLSRAVEQQELAVIAAPRAAVYRADLAWLYRTAGDREGARREILAAVRRDPLNVRFQSAVRTLIPRR